MADNAEHVSVLRTLRSQTNRDPKEIAALTAAILALSPAAAGYRPFAYSQIDATDDPDVFEHHLYLLPPGHEVPEGCEPLYTRQPQGVVGDEMVERAMNACIPGGSAAWVWLFNCEGGMAPQEKHRDWFRRILTAALHPPTREGQP
jgi:hypothetical protein